MRVQQMHLLERHPSLKNWFSVPHPEDIFTTFPTNIFNCPKVFEKYVEIWFVLLNSILPLLGLGFGMLLLDSCVFTTGHDKRTGHFIWLEPSYWYIQLCKTLASSLLTLHKSVQCTDLIDRVFVFTFRLMLGSSKWYHLKLN